MGEGMSRNPVVLAIDLGSTFFKAGVFDTAGVFDRQMRPVATGRALAPHEFGDEGQAELPVAVAEDAFEQAVAEAMAGVDVDDLRAIAITCQAQTSMIAGADGRPLIPFITWQDTRARSLGPVDLPGFADYSSFYEPLPALAVCHLLALRHTRPDCLGPSARVMPLQSWFVRRLCGRSVLDDNLAAMTGLYSIPEKDWWAPALDLIGISRTTLPDIIPVGQSAGLTTAGAAIYGLPAGIPVVLAGNDQTAGAYGASVHESGATLITLGTAQVPYRWQRSEPPAGPGYVRGPYPRGGFYLLVADDAGSGTVDWARSILTGFETGEQFFDAAASVPSGCGGLAFQPDVGSGRGSWTGIARSHTPAYFARAVVEGLARRASEAVRLIEGEDSARPLVVAGGGGRFKTWLDIIEQTLGRPVTVTDASPLTGAAKMAWEAIGQGVAHQCACG